MTVVQVTSEYGEPIQVMLGVDGTVLTGLDADGQAEFRDLEVSVGGKPVLGGLLGLDGGETQALSANDARAIREAAGKLRNATGMKWVCGEATHRCWFVDGPANNERTFDNAGNMVSLAAAVAILLKFSPDDRARIAEWLTAHAEDLETAMWAGTSGRHPH